MLDHQLVHVAAPFKNKGAHSIFGGNIGQLVLLEFLGYLLWLKRLKSDWQGIFWSNYEQMKVMYDNCGVKNNERRLWQLKTELFAVVKRKPEKNSGLYGIWTLDLCNTGVAFYQLSQQANWEQVIRMMKLCTFCYYCQNLVDIKNSF